MRFIHLFTLSMFILNFSGMPVTTIADAVPGEAFETRFEMRSENDEFIPWLIQRKLSWEDFSGEPRKNSEAVASTSTSLGIAYQVEKGNLSYRITCNFSRHKSWGLLKTEYILAHEQGHFDITEIAARKLHQALYEYEFNRKSYRDDINTIYQRIVKEKEDMQALYDRESDHSRNRKVQYTWNEKISLMLSETAPWAEYP
jgi:hypothetical protein